MNREDNVINLRIIFEIDKINKIEELFNKLFSQMEELKKRMSF